MPFSVPSFATIRERTLADIDAAMGTFGAKPGPVEYAIGSAVAGASYLIHVAVAAVARNHVPSTAEEWVVRLWAAFFGIFPKGATKNAGVAEFPATSGATIPAGATLRLRNGVEFTTDASATEAGGTISVAFTAIAAGAAGRSAAGATIFLGSPIAGVTSQGVVPAGISGGTDAEKTSSVLQRLLERLRNPPKGGTDADWIAWTKETPGVDVASAWVLTNVPPAKNGLGPSSVLVLFTVSGTNPIPLAGDESLATAYLALKKPVDVLAHAARAPIAQPTNYDVQLSPNTADVRAAVEAAIRQLHADEAAPGGTILLSHINEAISRASGELDHVLVSPAANVVATSAQHLATVGTFNFASI